jgi:hypothetical protein
MIVLEFIQYEDWHFVVMPFYDGCYWPRFANAAEGLDFAEQVLSVSYLSGTVHVPCPHWDYTPGCAVPS